MPENFLKKLTAKRRFQKLARETGGMMHPGAYRRIHEAVIQAPFGDVVEIGGAAGTGSIAVGWALQERCIGEKIIVVEKCEGGSRARRGDYATNRELIESNFARFGVTEQVRLYPHALTRENGPEVCALIETPEIGTLIHDADGRVDRDFAIFWPHLADGALIIIDDYGPELEFKPRGNGAHGYVGKRLLTFAMLNKLRDWGLFIETDRFNSVLFGYKPSGANFSQFDPALCEAIAQDIKNLTHRLNGKSVPQ